MSTEDRATALRGPISCCAAAIDAARVLANLTNETQSLYLVIGDSQAWRVLPASSSPDASWIRAGGAYAPGEERSAIATNPTLTPELAAERGILR